MRITAGIWKGKSLSVPDLGTRPSTERTRQALFDILQHVLAGASVLDLYAGAGALSLEALSRGALSAVAVDNDQYACRIIKKNQRALSCSVLTTVCDDVSSFLKRPPANPYSLIFADPPYEQLFQGSLLHQTLSHPNLKNFCNSETLFVAETPHPLTEVELALLPLPWKRILKRKYGKTHLSILQVSA